MPIMKKALFLAFLVLLLSCSNIYAAVAVRSWNYDSGQGNVSNQVTVVKPSDVQNGDYLVCILGVGDDIPAASGPAGWTTYQGSSSTGNDRQIIISYKKVTDAGSEPSTYTFTVGSSDYAVWWTASLSGVDPDTPEDVSMAYQIAHRQNDPSPITVTYATSTANAFVLAGFAINYDSATTAPVSGWYTQLKDEAYGISLSVYSQTKVSAGNVDCEITGVTDTEETSAGIWAFRAATSNNINTSDERASAINTIFPYRRPLPAPGQ